MGHSGHSSTGRSISSAPSTKVVIRSTSDDGDDDADMEFRMRYLGRAKQLAAKYGYDVTLENTKSNRFGIYKKDITLSAKKGEARTKEKLKFSKSVFPSVFKIEEGLHELLQYLEEEDAKIKRRKWEEECKKRNKEREKQRRRGGWKL